MARLRFILVAAFVLVMMGCPVIDQGLPENTISFTFDGVNYSYSMSSGLSTHAWGRGIVYGSPPPQEYYITASATEADALDYTNTIEISFSAEGDYYMWATVYDAQGEPYNFDLGQASHTLLEHIVANLDAEGEQMQGAFIQDYTITNPPHTLEDIIFSVERLEDYYPPQAE
jgi:hypothetical protein